jgi:hypothetical protein
VLAFPIVEITSFHMSPRPCAGVQFCAETPSGSGHKSGMTGWMNQKKCGSKTRTFSNFQTAKAAAIYSAAAFGASASIVSMLLRFVANLESAGS